jgi:hypothetical protein
MSRCWPKPIEDNVGPIAASRMIKDVIMREMDQEKGAGRPGRTPRRHRAAALATGPFGLYVASLRRVRAGMTSPYRIERDRGTKEARQQLSVLREKWPLAFPVQHQDARRLAMGVARQIAAAMGWVASLYARRAWPLENGGGLLPSRTLL